MRRLAPWLTWPGERAADRAARSEVLTRLGARHGGVTCDSPGKTLVRWGGVRVVTTGWRRVVTTRLAQVLGQGAGVIAAVAFG